MVTANEIKRKGVACITESLAQAPEVAISVRGKNAYVGYGPVGSANRLVRTRMLGGVGAGVEQPSATRLENLYINDIQ